MDFDKDINDASEALQEAKSLIRLDVHPHVVTYMDTWLHRSVTFILWILTVIFILWMQTMGWLADKGALPRRDTPVSPFDPAVNELCILMEYCSKGDLFDRLERDRAAGQVQDSPSSLLSRTSSLHSSLPRPLALLFSPPPPIPSFPFSFSLGVHHLHTSPRPPHTQTPEPRPPKTQNR